MYHRDGRLYRFAAEPYNYMALWTGLPPAANGRGSRELGDLTFGLSDNEQKALLVAGVALGGFFWWKKSKGKK